jgi:beta-N-acetylhexosaminidase
MPPLSMHSHRHHRTALFLLSIVAICLVACTSRAGTATGKATATVVVKPTASATARPIATATPRPDPVVASAQYYVDQMSLDEKIGQLLYAQSFSGGIYQDPTSTIIRKFQPGGLIIYQGELQSAPQATTYFRRIQADSKIPVLIGTDNEGGGEWRLQSIYPKGMPSAQQIGATNDPKYAYQQGANMAKMSLSIGMNVDLAPVVDVSAYDSRDFGGTPAQVTKMAGAWMQGLQDNGVIGTLKHFPGLGGTSLDPHSSLPVITHSRSVIESVDLAPYRNLINGNDPPGIIMSTDILMTAVDPTVPAEISYPIITGLLRNELHYNGVVMTDALYMGGMGQYMCNLDHVAHCNPLTYARNNPDVLTRLGIMALQAGCDMILGTFSVENTQAMVDGIKSAIKNGTLTMARIDQSVLRIITLKMRRGLLHMPPPPAHTPGQQPGNAPNDAAMRDSAGFLR